MSIVQSLVREHYRQPELGQALLAALARSGTDIASLRREDLAPIEEFHIGGREATRALARVAGLQPGWRVLDLGSGIGGPARTLAAEFGCNVVGVDLVEESCRTAADLTARVGLSDRVQFRCADALDTGLESASFDAVVLEHVNMNIADKGGLFYEAARVLRPGGRLALYEICAGPVSPVHFPVPWAVDARTSFLIAPEVLRWDTEAAGFKALVWEDVSRPAMEQFQTVLANLEQSAPNAPPLGINLVMGADAKQKITNVVRNLEEARVRLIRAVLALTGS